MQEGGPVTPLWNIDLKDWIYVGGKFWKYGDNERNLEYWDRLPVDHDVGHGGGKQGVEDFEEVDQHEEEGEDAKARALALVPITCTRLSDSWLFENIQLFLNWQPPPSLAAPTLVSNSRVFAFSAKAETLKASSLLRTRSWSLRAETLKATSLLRSRSRRVKVGAMLCSLKQEEAFPPTWVAWKVKGRSGQRQVWSRTRSRAGRQAGRLAGRWRRECCLVW